MGVWIPLFSDFQHLKIYQTTKIFKMENNGEFNINKVRSWNYTGPQQEFEQTNLASQSFNSSSNEERTGKNTNHAQSVDWNRMVDNVFMEEIAKFSSRYSRQSY